MFLNFVVLYAMFLFPENFCLFFLGREKKGILGIFFVVLNSTNVAILLEILDKFLMLQNFSQGFGFMF
jgi:hypothetical protein